MAAERAETEHPGAFEATVRADSLAQAWSNEPAANHSIKVGRMWLVRGPGRTTADCLNDAELAVLAQGGSTSTDAPTDVPAARFRVDYGHLEDGLTWEPLETPSGTYEHAKIIAMGEQGHDGMSYKPPLFHTPAELIAFFAGTKQGDFDDIVGAEDAELQADGATAPDRGRIIPALGAAVDIAVIATDFPNTA